jgi:hypothetical protein
MKAYGNHGLFSGHCKYGQMVSFAPLPLYPYWKDEVWRHQRSPRDMAGRLFVSGSVLAIVWRLWNCVKVGLDRKRRKGHLFLMSTSHDVTDNYPPLNICRPYSRSSQHRTRHLCLLDHKGHKSDICLSRLARTEFLRPYILFDCK